MCFSFLASFHPPTHPHTQKLDLHSNSLGWRSTKAIAQGLQEGGGMPCLDELYLDSNGIRCAGAT